MQHVIAEIVENEKTKHFDAIVADGDIEEGIRAIRAEVGHNPTTITVISAEKVPVIAPPIVEDPPVDVPAE